MSDACKFQWPSANRAHSGGLELNFTRIDHNGYHFAHDEYRIVSIARGQGVATIAGIEQEVKRHDHFGIPAGLQAELRQTGDEPLVAWIRCCANENVAPNQAARRASKFRER